MKYINVLLFSSLLFTFTACSEQQNVKKDAYRYISFEAIPRGELGKVTGNPYWDMTHYIKEAVADTFFVYGNFDSIRVKIPPEAYGRMYRKAKFKAATWIPKPNYGELLFVGLYEADDLAGLFMSYYATPDRSSVLQLHYTNPGNMSSAMLFHKDSVNILKKQSIVIDPRDEQQ